MSTEFESFRLMLNIANLVHDSGVSDKDVEKVLKKLLTAMRSDVGQDDACLK